MFFLYHYLMMSVSGRSFHLHSELPPPPACRPRNSKVVTSKYGTCQLGSRSYEHPLVHPWTEVVLTRGTEGRYSYQLLALAKVQALNVDHSTFSPPLHPASRVGGLEGVTRRRPHGLSFCA